MANKNAEREVPIRTVVAELVDMLNKITMRVCILENQVRDLQVANMQIKSKLTGVNTLS